MHIYPDQSVTVRFYPFLFNFFLCVLTHYSSLNTSEQYLEGAVNGNIESKLMHRALYTFIHKTRAIILLMVTCYRLYAIKIMRMHISSLYMW